MAAMRRSLFLAWAVLNLLFPEVEGAGKNNPCKHQHRKRLSNPYPGKSWGPTVFVSIVIIFCIAVALICYIPTSIILCTRNQSGQEPCQDTPEVPPVQAGLASCQPRCYSRSVQCADRNETPSQKLKSMERLLEGFLNEVQSQKQALEKVLGENVATLCVDRHVGPLDITIFDCKDPATE